MDNQTPELDKIRHPLLSIEKPKKQKILVVDDEQDNLDLLYRTFRRDFHVLKADSGMKALQILATEGEVAVIISDQRMPQMKGTEFLSKTVPQFPDTLRIILTGFTDVQDLVEAINTGQVYKFITKPWDPGQLKAVVQQAAQTYDLLKQRTEELQRAHAQIALLSVLVQVTQEYTCLETTLNSIARAFGENFATHNCILQLVKGNTLAANQGSYSTTGKVKNWLAQDPLTIEAISPRLDAQRIVTHEMQISLNVLNDEKLLGVADYCDNKVQAHLVIPITYCQEVLAVLSLQWQEPQTLSEDELKFLDLSAEVIAIALRAVSAHDEAPAGSATIGYE
ncbi:two-component system response regulator [Brasilonema octagenarum UFV-E1]|uniref:Two-component system response regulator n=2 Tax=Brasilonema TaxID=383614 RepID=A0A856M658_9CYAN|nr:MULTISPECIES: response regulator [Brasilonema]NMF62376.1 two-component system response regulator [Brasilonema octagenarum UFV-OR1]QDL06655.1 two-component system response regulator [Brasilonema sennae CENA114]QDL13023.1 two-component system response regulator [Brasilonema octagenarum UFV-E1]